MPSLAVVDDRLRYVVIAQLDELESTYKAKIAAEIERYDKLIANRDVFSGQWDTTNASLISSHQEYVARLLRQHEERITAEEVCLHTTPSVYVSQLHLRGVIILPISVSVTTACAKRTGAAASVERRRRESARTISLE